MRKNLFVIGQEGVIVALEYDYHKLENGLILNERYDADGSGLTKEAAYLAAVTDQLKIRLNNEELKKERLNLVTQTQVCINFFSFLKEAKPYGMQNIQDYFDEIFEATMNKKINKDTNEKTYKEEELRYFREFFETVFSFDLGLLNFITPDENKMKEKFHYSERAHNEYDTARIVLNQAWELCHQGELGELIDNSTQDQIAA